MTGFDWNVFAIFLLVGAALRVVVDVILAWRYGR